MEQSSSGQPGGMIERAKRLLLQPRAEWQAIEAAPMSPSGIFGGWVLPLAAIGPVATLIGSLVFGYSMFGVTYRPGVGAALSLAVTSYVLAIVSVFVLALVIDALAPSFGGTRNQRQALKVAAFSMTAGWLAGIFNLIPMLSFLALLGLYSLYLLYVGLPILMRVPQDKAIGYTIVTILVGAVLMIVASFAAGMVTKLFAPVPFSGADTGGSVSGKVSIPGVGSVDLGKMEEAAKQLEKASEQAASGTVAATAPDVLQAMLPTAIAGFQRTEVSNSAAGAGGIGGSTAEGRYQGEGASFRLQVTDMAAVGGIAALGSAFNVQSSRETASGYERTQTIDGRMTSEEWNRDSKNGKYSILVANRFLVEARGEAPDIETLKGAVGQIDAGKLERLAK